ncbi:hypothetical protein EV188_11248 [Actinomycetospora succinea]|uniref:Uncharacterized protein n=1 Tax=Actinomycetospora succinea TaxID=663603 RepID=A0A4R6UL86_9PSEU|nr:hypothetical protein [Actinomycetospora succinea]TDQ47778.1 hypothetical protein EV188_11248 [Actinomycetospora succinea]
MDEKTPDQPYTIHRDVDVVHDQDAGESAPATRPGPDPLGLVAGLTAIVIAVLALTGALASVDPRWVLVIGAVGVGSAVLWMTLRRRQT